MSVNMKIILKAIEDIKKNKADARQLLIQQLKEKIDNEEISLLLDSALMGLGFITVDGNIFKKADLPSEQLKGEELFNADLYQKILPLCKLAKKIENNGLARQHACKLATIFKNEQAVLDYLLHFAKNDSSDCPLHNACLFDLPLTANCHFKDWKRLAVKNMKNPRFRELLPLAEKLEGSYYGNIKNVKMSLILEKKSEISQLTKQYKRILTQDSSHFTEQEKESRRQKLADLSQEKLELQLQLAEFCIHLPFKYVDLPILEARYAFYRHSVDEAHGTLITYGISPAAIAHFDKLKPQNDDFLIPNLIVDGQQMGHAGFYIKKLDVLNPEGAALAACLGKITNCCQYLGGAADSCVVHGITSADSGFYVLCRGDSQNPSISDTSLPKPGLGELRAGVFAWIPLSLVIGVRCR